MDMTAAKAADAPRKPATNATAGPADQDAATQISPETRPSRARRSWPWLKSGFAAALEFTGRIVARAKALLPPSNKAAAETAADEAAADAPEDRREPVLADEAALAVMQGPGGSPRKGANRDATDSKSTHAEDAPAAPPEPVRRLTIGHAYAALAGLILGTIIGASLFWNLALVQTKRMHRAYAQSEASVAEILQLKEDLAVAEQKLAEAAKLSAKHSPVRPPAVRTGPDAACDLSGSRGEMLEELRSCLKQFTRASR